MAAEGLTHTTMGAKLHLYRRENSSRWQCSTYLAGRNHRVSTGTEDRTVAEEFARNWRRALHERICSGELNSEGSATGGQASPPIDRGNEDRPRSNVAPHPAKVGASEAAPGSREGKSYSLPPARSGRAPWPGSHTFSEKLNLALKALSMTRGQLAVELGVDKSLIGRWARGAVRPSAENLARLTGLIARHVPGFTILDWERDLGSLVELLGVDPEAAGIVRPRLGSAFQDGLLAEAVETTARLGATYEGFFRSTRPHGGAAGVFLHDHMMVRRGSDGLMRFELRCDLVRVEGWVLPQRDLLIVIGAEDASGSPAFGIFNVVMSQRADVIDGLLLACSMEAGRTPTACSIVFERVGELSGDAAADEARLDELSRTDPVATPASAPSVLTEHLVRDIGPAQLALGGDWLLRLPLARSIARGRGIDQREGGFARAFPRPADAP